MTREEIKKAAQEKVERLANIAYAGGGHIGQDDLETVFVLVLNGASTACGTMFRNVQTNGVQ